MKVKMNCSQIKRKLSAFLDGEVSEEQKSLISEHLKSCAYCLKDLEELSRVSDFLDVMEEVGVSPYFMVHLKRRIAEEKSKRFVRLPFLEWVKRVAVPVGVAALFVIAILGGNYLGRVLNQRIDKVTELNEEIANVAGVNSFDDFSEGSLVDAYNGLLTEGGK